MKSKGSSNHSTVNLIKELDKKGKADNIKIWKRLAKDLKRPRRIRRAVNLSRIDRNCNENDVVLVPGKVLGSGKVNKIITISALEFSESSIRKIKENKGKCLSIQELIKKYPDGKKIKIIG